MTLAVAKISLGRLKALWKKEALQYWRNPLLLAIFLSAVTLQLILFGYSADSQIRNIPLQIWDRESSVASREFIQALTSNGHFVISGFSTEEGGLREALSAGRAEAGMIIPAGFNLRGRGESGQELIIFLDGSQANSAIQARNYIHRALEKGSGPALAIKTEYLLLHNPGLKGSRFMISGGIGAILALMITPLAAAAFAREKETGTLAGLQVSPVLPLEFFLGKAMPLFFISLLNAVIAYGVACWWFQLPLSGSLSLLALSTIAYLVFCIAVGFIAARFSNTQFQAMLSCLLVVFPELFLSGGMGPSENWPDFLRALAWINPLYYFVKLNRGALLLGQGWGQNGWLFLLLAGFSLMVLLAALRQTGRFFTETAKAQ